jgi:hypothetical protein
MSLFLVFVVALCTSTQAFQSNVRSSTHTSRQSLRMDTAEKNFFQEDSTKRMMNMIEADTRVPKVSLADQLRLMQSTDIAMADNYWEGTMPRTKKIRSAAAKTKDVASRIKVDENYYDLMNTGFDRRFSDEKRGESPLLAAAKLTSFQLELAKSKSEQLADLSKQRLEERTGVMKVVPPGLHKFIDYANSMYKKPAQSEVVKNLSLGGFFKHWRQKRLHVLRHRKPRYHVFAVDAQHAESDCCARNGQEKSCILVIQRIQDSSSNDFILHHSDSTKYSDIAIPFTRPPRCQIEVCYDRQYAHHLLRDFLL